MLVYPNEMDTSTILLKNITRSNGTHDCQDAFNQPIGSNRSDPVGYSRS